MGTGTPLKSILRAFAVLGASSLVTVLAGLITMKVVAFELGPSGLGLLALLQSLAGVAAIVAGFGIATALVRHGADALSGDDTGDLDGLWSAAWMVFWAFSVPMSVAIFVFRIPIAGFFLGDSGESQAVAWASLALPLVLAGALNTAFINANHRVSLLARQAVYVAVGQTIMAVFIIVMMGRSGVPLIVVSGGAIMWAASRWMLTRHFPDRSRVGLGRGAKSVRPLLGFGGPYAMSSMFGAGVLFLLPVMVVAMFDEASVGYVRAASAISVTYVGFLLAAMSQDYFPRLSAVSRDHKTVNEMVNQQLNVIYLIAVPFIFLAMALAPVAIPILYSDSFEPSVGVLEWQLVGDVFKFASWALAFTILARGRTWTFFGTEAIAGGLLLVTTFVALSVVGLQGYGLAYAVSYALYLVAVYVLVHKEIGFRFTGANLQTVALLGAGTVAVRILMLAVDTGWVYLVPGVLGIITALLSIRRGAGLWRTS